MVKDKVKNPTRENDYVPRKYQRFVLNLIVKFHNQFLNTSKKTPTYTIAENNYLLNSVLILKKCY